MKQLRKYLLLCLSLCMIINIFFVQNIQADDWCPDGEMYDYDTFSCQPIPESSTQSSSDTSNDVEAGYWTCTDCTDVPNATVRCDGSLKKENCYIIDSNGKKTGQTFTYLAFDKMQASNSEKFTAAEGVEYFTYTAGNVEDLFNLEVKDVTSIGRATAWLLQNNSYIVRKEADGQSQIFWNVPNVQQSLFNSVLSNFGDGFTDEAYVVEDTQKIIKVGSNSTRSQSNPMVKYGFNIPSYKYIGEIPVVYLSLSRIVPTNIFQAVWRLVKSVVTGSSFLNAPDASTYSTLRYMGHDYEYPYANIVEFIANYWDEYFVKKIYNSGDTFCSVTAKGSEVKDGCVSNYILKDSKSQTRESGYTVVDSHGNIRKGSMGELYVSEASNESAREWTKKYYRALIDADGNNLYSTTGGDLTHDKHFKVESVTITKPYQIDFGSKVWDNGQDLDALSVTTGDIHVRDVYTIEEQIDVIIENDRQAAREVAENRCKLKLTSDKEITEKRDGVKDLTPNNEGCDILGDYWGKDKNCASAYYSTESYDETGVVEVGKTFQEYVGDAYTGSWQWVTPKYCNTPSTYHRDDSLGAAGSSCTVTISGERWIDEADYYQRLEGDSHPANSSFAGVRKEYNKCVDDYSAIYEKCVNGEAKDNEKICAIEKRSWYAVPYYNTYVPRGSFKAGTSVFEMSYELEGPYDGLKHNLYTFERPLNYWSNGELSTNGQQGQFTSGYKRLTIFGKRFDEGDDLPPTDKMIENIIGIKGHSQVSGGYAKNKETVARYQYFMEHWKQSFKRANHYDNHIYYNQCLISSEEKNTCIKDGSSISVKQIYVDSGIWNINLNPDLEKYYTDNTLTDELKLQRAEQIVQKIENYSAQYYPEVMNSIIELMIRMSDNTIALDEFMTKRVLPYNLDLMISGDAELVGVKDPRYHGTIVEQVLNLNVIPAVFDVNEYISTKLLSVISFISEITVQLVQWMNFDFLEDRSLAPNSLWTNNYLLWFELVLLIWFLVKLVLLAKDVIVGSGALRKLVTSFLTFILLFSLTVVTIAAPDNTWKAMRNTIETTMNLGETSVIGINNKYASFYSAANNDSEVLYWLVYFDSWSLYNTGYGILEPEQTIDLTLSEDDYPEISTLHGHSVIPSGITSWSWLLADSFVSKNGSLAIDNNAYRVVDHFMAPRVKLHGSAFTVTENENYNGLFQNNFLGLIPKMFGSIVILFLVLIKFLTFLYLWYMLYMLIVNLMIAILGGTSNIKKVIVDTFAPVVALLAIGLWIAFTMYVTALSVNDPTSILTSLIFIIAIFYATLRLLEAWKEKIGHFPSTLMPIYFIVRWILHGTNPFKEAKQGLERLF